MVVLRIEGACADEAAAAVAERLNECEQQVAVRGTEVSFCAPSACSDDLHFEIDPNDPPRFAAEKILDALAGKGLIDLKDDWMSPEEEAAIRDRLKRLGYIE